MGFFVARHTFYIGVNGKLLYVDHHVSPKTAGDDLVARLETLYANRTGSDRELSHRG